MHTISSLDVIRELILKAWCIGTECSVTDCILFISLFLFLLFFSLHLPTFISYSHDAPATALAPGVALMLQGEGGQPARVIMGIMGQSDDSAPTTDKDGGVYLVVY